MLKHINFQATEYVIVTGGNGRIKKQGYGLGFFYNNASTSIKVIPSTAFDTSYMFNDIITHDFQNISSKIVTAFSVNPLYDKYPHISVTD